MNAATTSSASSGARTANSFTRSEVPPREGTRPTGLGRSLLTAAVTFQSGSRQTWKQEQAAAARRLRIVIVLLGLCASTPLLGQAFDSGSNGSYGALNVTTNTTLDMPADGIFNCTTITVASGATLTFKKNALNTPVYLLAKGDVNVQGTIDVSGGNTSGGGAALGGPGGFDGGFGRFAQLVEGDGHGPGGGKGGGDVSFSDGVFAVPGYYNTNIYGSSLLIPLIGGSGAGAYSTLGGGGGGGALLLASSTRVKVDGNLNAIGGMSSSGYCRGSGGGIRIVAPLLEGVGYLNATGQSGNNGRVRIDSPDRYAYRNLHVYGQFARGSNMIVFPPGNPRLDIISAAGTAIPEGTNSAVSIMLPSGSSTNQVVRVQARNFTNDIPIRVKVTPENGSAGTFDSVILLTSGNPPYTDVNVTIVPEMTCHVYVWTR